MAMSRQSRDLERAPPGKYEVVLKTALLDDDETPESDVAWYRDVDSDKFGSLVGGVISLNAIIMGLETDFGSQYFWPFEWFFFTFFTLEFILRAQQLRCD